MPLSIKRPERPKVYPRMSLVALQPRQTKRGMVRRWQVFEAAGVEVGALLRDGLAIENPEAVGLSRHGIRRVADLKLSTLDDLQRASFDLLRRGGLQAADVEAVAAWRGEASVAKDEDGPAPAVAAGEVPENLRDIPGIGPKVLEQLQGVGIETPMALLAAPSEMLADMRLGKALSKIEDWRSQFPELRAELEI
ncbi:MAG: helix-hairpin-helix domain-containing protein [Acidobacteriota bacterium]